jgi:ParB family chromosome partitioning protein
MKKKQALGKGIRALIPEEKIIVNEENGNKEYVLELDINKIKPNTDQPRKHFDREKLDELAASIREHGIIQPLVLRKENNHYLIVAGERRWRASKQLGLSTVPAIIKDLPEEEVMEIALIENIQRENLNAIEEALGYQNLMDTFNLTQGEVGIKLGKSRVAVTNTLRLLNLPKEIQDAIISGALSSGHGRAILGLKKPKQQLEMLLVIMTKSLTVRETEEYVKNFKVNKEKSVKVVKEDKDPYITAIEEKLQEKYQTRVNLKHKKNKGRIEIEYYSLDELQGLLERLGYEE